MSQNKLIGWSLEIVSGLCFMAALIIGLGPCAETFESAALFSVQTCYQTTVEIVSLVFFGVVFSVVAYILLRKDKKADLVFGALCLVWGTFALISALIMGSNGFGSDWWPWFDVLIMALGVNGIWRYFKRGKQVQSIEDQLMREESQRRSTGLRGSFSLDAETVDAQVGKVSPGVFALGTKEGKVFHVHYVGRSDVDVSAELKEYVGKYDRFKFDYTDPYSSDAAFLKECRLYHNFRGPEGRLDNQHHPSRPSDAVSCPTCGDPNRKAEPVGLSESSASKHAKQFCVSCGNPLPEGSKFCNRCGTQQP